MTHREFANAVLGLIERSTVAATAHNAKALLEIHETLGALAQGQLILAKSVPDEAPKE